jgi:hypothetical protein
VTSTPPEASPAPVTPADQHLADALLDRLRRWAAAVKRWDGATPTRVYDEVVRREFHGVRNAGPDSGRDEPVLARCLAALAQQGEVRPMKDSRPRHLRDPDGLPPGIHLLPYRERPTKTPARPDLHPDLAALLGDAPIRTDTQRVGYRAISDWLHTRAEAARRFGRLVPHRERALEILGRRELFPYFPEPEKAFDGDGFHGPLFASEEAKARFFELIQAFRTRPPLLSAHFEECEAVGPGDVLLVVENSATYTSLIRCLQRVDHRIGCVAWGIGASFVRSVRSIRDHLHAQGRMRQLDFSKIVYFGDLDTSGLRIPLNASAHGGPGIPEIHPARALYRALVSVGTPLPAKESERAQPPEAERLVAWLGSDPIFAQLVHTLVAGDRLAQEWVGLRFLTETEAWLEDVR